jgi:sulfate adenylyltransferase subunit 2
LEHRLSTEHLDQLESEAVYVVREAVAQFRRPALLFSGGKDSIAVLHLARKAFHPAPLPFPLLHIDTGHNFPETIQYRDALVDKLGLQLIVGSVQESIDKGRVKEETDYSASRNVLQSVTLLDTIKQHGFDALIGGARRDEEKSRSKERFFSRRDANGGWNPHDQQPELWMLLNGRHRPGEHFRVFPLSNWTELDVWLYLQRERVDLPSLYFAHNRNVFQRDGVWYAQSDYMKQKANEETIDMSVRFRTVGDMTCTGAVESNAKTIDNVVLETIGYRTSERGTRADDKRSAAAMEERKREGYF